MKTSRSALAAGFALLTAWPTSLVAQTSITSDGAIESKSGGFVFPDGETQATTAVRSVYTSVPRTGQTSCWDDLFNPTACAGTGQDGDHQAGIEWPTPRFTDNGDGTVTDNLTGLIWLEDADCFGGKVWLDALADANGLASGACGLTDGSVAGDWRLPNVNELASLIDWGQQSPALPQGHPFSNVQNGDYWTSTGYVMDDDTAWIVDLETPRMDALLIGGGCVGKKACQNGVWPVRGGDDWMDHPAPVQGTGMNTRCWGGSSFAADAESPCAGTGQDAELQVGVKAFPRFTDNGDGTVTDRLTGLVWLRDFFCFGGSTTWEQALSNASGLMDGSCGLTDGSAAGDWRLPNIRELWSLADLSNPEYFLASGALFPPTPPGSIIKVWSSTTWIGNLGTAVTLESFRGRATGEFKGLSQNNITWPVRDAQ